MKYEATITYFKPSGKYYASGHCTVEGQDSYEVDEIVRAMLLKGQRPGLGRGDILHAHVTTSHPNSVPFMVPGTQPMFRRLHGA